MQSTEVRRRSGPTSSTAIAVRSDEDERPTLEHSVQFYDSEEFISAAIAEVIGAGLAVGDPVLVIASARHVKGACEQLQRGSIDVAASVASKALRFLDAESTLAKISSEGKLDEVA